MSSAPSSPPPPAFIASAPPPTLVLPRPVTAAFASRPFAAASKLANGTAGATLAPRWALPDVDELRLVGFVEVVEFAALWRGEVGTSISKPRVDPPEPKLPEIFDKLGLDHRRATPDRRATA
jgi:hypothetical protein